jgi:hypothetical protein
MRYPDEDLAVEQVGLDEFAMNCQDIMLDGPAFVRYALAGRRAREDLGNGDGDGDSERHTVNVRQDVGATAPQLGECTLVRDFDSATGKTRTLPFTQPLAIFPLSPFKETLKKDNHVTHTIHQNVSREISKQASINDGNGS